MRIFLTGSSGFIGFHLAKKLLAKGCKVFGIDNHNEHYDPELKYQRLKILQGKNFSFQETDLNNLNFIDGEFDIGINLAAQPGVRLEKKLHYLYEKSNINGFKSFCDFCVNKNIKKIIYASSSSVYSEKQNSKFKEDITDLQPKSKYGETKLANEIYMQKLVEKKHLTAVGLRLFSVYGPWGRPDMAYYSFTESLKNNKQIILFNEGKMARDMTYIDDVIDGILKSLEYVTHADAQTHEIFNLGNDHPIKTLQVLNTIQEKIGLNAEISYETSSTEAEYTHANIEKAKNILAYSPRVVFDRGIENFLEWHEEYEKR